MTNAIKKFIGYSVAYALGYIIAIIVSFRYDDVRGLLTIFSGFHLYFALFGPLLRLQDQEEVPFKKQDKQWITYGVLLMISYVLAMIFGKSSPATFFMCLILNILFIPVLFITKPKTESEKTQ
jgi:hypothetical protein